METLIWLVMIPLFWALVIAFTFVEQLIHKNLLKPILKSKIYDQLWEPGLLSMFVFAPPATYAVAFYLLDKFA